MLGWNITCMGENTWLFCSVYASVVVRNDFSPDPDPTFQVIPDPNPDPDPDPDLTVSGQLDNLQILCVNNGTMQQEF